MLQSCNGCSPLHIAIKRKDFNKAKSLLESCPEDAKVQDRKRNLPLHFAVCHGDSDMVKVLLKAFPKGAMLRNSDGDLPLNIASRRKYLDIAKLLLESYPEAAKVQNSNGNSQLHIVAKRQDFDTVKLLTEFYPEAAMMKNKEGDLSLHIACTSKSFHIGEFLLKLYPEGSKVRNKNGQIPLHISCQNNDAEMIILLLKTHSEGAKVKDKKGWLPLLHTINYSGSFDIIKMLFDAYPEASTVKTNEGNLPLHVACKIHTSDIDNIVQFLLKAYPAGAKVQNLAGLLPLHIALERRAFNAAKLLLEEYPDASIVRNKAGKSPLLLLCKYYYSGQHPSDPKYNLEWLDLFISANPVGIDIRDQKGKFPSDILRRSTAKPKLYFIDQEGNLPSDILQYEASKHGELSTNADDYMYIPREVLFWLHDAVKRGVCKHVVKLLLQAFPASCLIQDEKGMVPMHYVCSSTMPNFFENFVVLLEFDALSLLIEDTQGRTPLQCFSADAFAVLETDVFLIHHLAGHSLNLSVELLIFVVNFFPKSLSTPDKRGMLPFHHAALNSASSIEVLMYFLCETPDVIRPSQP
jgi:ankyrin repeat protein